MLLDTTYICVRDMNYNGIVFKSFSPLSSSITNSDLNFAEKFLLVRDIIMILLYCNDYSISDSLKNVS